MAKPRSPAEIVFRLRQEAHNLWRYFRPPSLPAGSRDATMTSLLPDGRAAAVALKSTPYAAEVGRLADQVLAHRFELLGLRIDAGPRIDWSRDALSGKKWMGSEILRRIPYLDSERVGDHKVIWEMNRHQHLVLLAQAWLLTSRRAYIDEVEAQLDDWIAANPYAQGMQWVSALEVAFRVLSWLWVWRLAGDELRAETRERLLEAIWRHGVFLERNLSTYFSPNTHLLGEAVALHAVGRLLPDLPYAHRWRALGQRIVAEQMDAQVRPDGSHFEQSAYYHVYSCDFFLLHALLEETSESYRDRLGRMGDYLWSLLGPAGRIPLLGDDDGGRLFHPYGERVGFGRATLAALGLFLERTEWPRAADDAAQTAAWWIGPSALAGCDDARRSCGRSRLYENAKLAVLCQGAREAIVDAGAFGAFGAGHSHEHALSLLLRDADRELLIDPGAYTYTGDPSWRALFRSAAMHNTVRIEGVRQAEPTGPFGWGRRAESEIELTDEGAIEAACRYCGYTHHRRVAWSPDSSALQVTDTIEGPAPEASLEQIWRPGVAVLGREGNVFALDGGAELRLPAAADVEASSGGADGWRSTAYGVKSEAAVIRRRYQGSLPVRLEAEIVFAD